MVIVNGHGIHPEQQLWGAQLEETATIRQRHKDGGSNSDLIHEVRLLVSLSNAIEVGLLAAAAAPLVVTLERDDVR